MRISKITFKNKQAWIVVHSVTDEYLGTWHITDPDFVEYIRLKNPKELHFEDYFKKPEISQRTGSEVKHGN